MATDKKKKKAAPKKATAPKLTPPSAMDTAMRAAQEAGAKTQQSTAVNAISGGTQTPVQVLSGAGIIISGNLPKAFIPARTVIDTSGNAVIVDINGRDEAGNVVKEAPARKPSGVAGVESVLQPDGSYQLQIGDLTVEEWNKKAIAENKAAAAKRALEETPTTSLDVIKAGLRDIGLKGSIVDSGATFIDSLVRDGIVYENAIDVFLENKEYTFKDGRKMESPFYKEYGYLNEYAPEKKQPSELFGFVNGMEDLVKKYNISSKFASREKLIEATKNNVSFKDLDARANIARLKALTADPIRVDALKRLGYIKNNEDLTDFYLDTSVGIEEFENRRRTAYLTTEALRRASAGITIDTARMQQLAATLGAQGYTAEGVEREATAAYETIAQQLPELTKLSGIFEQGRAAKPQDIQQELESEQLLGMASQRRKRLEQANINIFSGEAGMARTRTSTAGMI